MQLARASLPRHLRTAVLGVALVCGAHSLVAGEPILFSGRTGQAAPMDFDRREPLLPAEARSGSRPEHGLEPTLTPPPVTPTTGLTRRQLEAQEQKRNWIFQSSETLLKQSTDRDNDKRDRDDGETSKSSVERFMEGKDAKSDRADKSRNSDSSNKPGNDRKDNSANPIRPPRADGSRDSTGLEMGGKGNARGSDGVNLFGGTDARGSSIGRAMSDARDRQRERDASLDAFKRTLNNPWAQPASSGMESSRVAGSSGPSNAGLPAAGMERRGLGGSLAPAGRAPMDLGPRGGMGEFDPKNPLNYGAPDTVLRNNEPPRVAPKPVILEIPKRKF